ncbi:hypothetical protein [Undibacterium sp. Ji22W]|uniref:hypothetical protein n=1 Tax=Undibacterium sp. Ji22W TaxID=3413038 RepID=UPI003BF10993
MMTNPITRGSRVKFDKDGTTLTGTVFHIVNDIGNGRKMAVIEIEHKLPGITMTMPFDELKAAPISQEVIFMTSPADALKPETNDRRFWAISLDSKRAS